jgi:tetratricopeptide (TPR) repeat protein
VKRVKKESLSYLAGGVLLGALAAYGIYDFARRPATSPATAPAATPVIATPEEPSASEEVANLERLVQADPANVVALTRLGNVMYDQARWTEALGYYRRALSAGPMDPNVLTDAGICCRQLGRPEDALEFFRRAQEADPAHWQSLFNAAIVAGFDLGRFDAAEDAVRKIVKINPSAPGLERLRRDLAQARAGRGSPS